MHKPKLVTKIINGVTLLIMFNREIGQVASDFQAGTYQTNPTVGLQNLLSAATGVTPSGTINYTALTASAYSKAGGYAFGKIAKWAARHFKM
jgi:hypothetical protein